MLTKWDVLVELDILLLLDAGHTKIAHLSGPIISSAARHRKEGFLQALSDVHINIAPDIISEGDLKSESGWVMHRTQPP